MKKRRELDALITKSSSSNSLRGSNKVIKNGNHELLRNDSYSSEGEEYSMADKELLPKKKVKQSSCLTCLFAVSVILLFSCIGIITCLIWMFIQLKNEVQDLKANLYRADDGELSPKMKSLPSRFDEMDKRLNRFIANDEKFNIFNISVANLQKEIKEQKEGRNFFKQGEEIKNLNEALDKLKNLVEDLKLNTSSMKLSYNIAVNKIDDLEGRLKSLQLTQLPSSSSAKSAASVKPDDDDQLVSKVSLMSSFVQNLTLIAFNEDFIRIEERINNSFVEIKNLTTKMNDRILTMEIQEASLVDDNKITNHVIDLINNNTNWAKMKPFIESIIEMTNASVKHLSSSVDDAYKALRREIQTMNMTTTKLTNELASIEFKVRSLAGQLEQLQKADSAVRLNSTSPADNNNNNNYQLTSTTVANDNKDMDGIGALSEIAVTPTAQPYSANNNNNNNINNFNKDNNNNLSSMLTVKPRV